MNVAGDSNECLQVFVRCRPLQESEMQLPIPVEVHPEVNKIIVRDVGCNKNAVKAFSFDKVFGPEAGQAVVYNNVAAPLIQEVIMGFNCTILAYGQTGTGKTFTIEGDRNATLNTSEMKDSNAGIIPRSMKHIFEELTNQKCDFEVNVSFLELYNEDIFDLLSKADDLTKLKLYDSSKGSVTVQGLEMRNVQSMQDVNDVLDKGCKKRRKAATFMNKVSSRSHTVFTVIVKMKEHSTTIEKTKTGKLNLVDLAGSENIGRSGAVENRAREAGSINRSLLALGRVITALCENANHIPYRQSKLTRLLRDSLGGQTKTTVIATISPYVKHLDETLNTLEYALRAKNIMNKPEVNAQVSATALTKDYLEKISSLELQIQELSSKVDFQVHPDNLKYLETAITTKAKELREECEIKEKLQTESEELDEAINKAMETMRLKELEWKNCISEQSDVAEKLVKEQEEIRSEEKELLILEPVMAKLHEKLHKVVKENDEIANEVKKWEETTSDVVNENSRLQKQFSNMCRAQSSFNEALLQFKNRLAYCINEVQITVKGEEMECDKHLSSLDSGFGSFNESSEKLCQQFKNILNDVEKLKSGFHDALVDGLRNEEIKSQERLLDIESNVSSLKSCNFDPLQPLLTNCEENLRNLFLSLSHWRDTLMQKLTGQENVLNNYLSAEDKHLWSLRESCKDVTQKQKEFIREYGEVISAALSQENDRKMKFDEKVSSLEEAMEQIQNFLTEKLDDDVDKSILAHDKFRDHADGEMRKVEAVLSFCESSLDSINTFQEGMSFSSNETLHNKIEEMKESANNSIANYKDLLPDFTNCVDQTKVSDESTKALEQRVNDDKVRRLEMPDITSIIQNFNENLMVKDQCCQNLCDEHQAELKTIETNQVAVLKEVHDSFDQFHRTYIQGVLGNISSIEKSDECGFSWKESIIKDNYDDDEDRTDDPNTTLLSTEENSDHQRTSVLDATFVLPEENGNNENENENGCKFCTNKDETLSAQNFPLSVAVVKPRKTSVSKMSKQNKNKKELTYYDLVEKWYQELFSEDAEDKTTSCDKSDSVA